MSLPVYVPGTFRRIGWAFLFLGVTVGPFFRFRDENFIIDLFPDFIGFLIITMAANTLIPFHSRARRLRNLALLLTYLSIPLIVQYTMNTSHSGNITTWRAPLWPLILSNAILELVLIWMLLGLVADIARRAGVSSMANSALKMRLVYVLAKFLMAVGMAAALLLWKPETILEVAVAELVGGLVLLMLMMTLMRRMERLILERVDLIEDAADASPSGGVWIPLLVLGGMILPLLLGVASAAYYLNWNETRAEESRKMSTSTYFTPARDKFFENLAAGRVDEAYAATTTSFRERVSPERFAVLARQYTAYLKLREAHNSLGSGASMSSGDESLSETSYIEFEKGKVIEVSATVRRDRDSIFYLHPPPVRVDEFNVVEKAMTRERPDGR